ncbi:hypothetical protein BH11BAC1_BH11BAC1_00080 [soil metagenome]
MVKRVTFIFLLLLFSIFAHAQKEGRAKIDSIETRLKNYSPICNFTCLADSTKVILLLDLAWEYSFNKTDTVLILCDEADRLSGKINYGLGIAQSDHVKANLYNGQSEYSNAIKYFSSEISVLEKLLTADKKSRILLSRKAAALNSWGNVYKNKGDFPMALEFFLKAQAVNEEFNNLEAIAINSKNIGDIYSTWGKFPEALDFFFKALGIAEKLNKDKISAATLGSIGLIYRKQDNFEKAKEYYSRALKLNQKLDDKRGVGIIYGNLGSLYLSRGNTAEAFDHFKMSLKEYEEVGYKKGIASAYINMGAIFNGKGEAFEKQRNTSSAYKAFVEALDYYFKGMRIVVEIEDKNTEAINLANIGLVYLNMKKYQDSETYFLKALQMSNSIDDLEGVMEVNQSLSRLYSETNKYKKAWEHYQLAVAAKDSVFNADKTEEITRKEMNFEQEKKDAIAKVEQEKKDALSIQEIEKQKLLRNTIAVGAGIITLSSLLSFFFYKRKRDAEQKQKETSLSLQVSETEMKALRSQMNPHFIFNALQSIQTFLLKNRSEDANIYLLKFSKLMRAVLENSRHSEVSLKDDMQALELYMQLESIRLPHPFTYQFNIDESIDVEEVSIPPLILQPFVENAIWHGLQYKPEPGHIDIFISKKDNALYATVEDNGIGRDMSKNLAHPMLLKKESLGMKLTEERLKILNEIKKIKAQFKITDLFTMENKPTGTRVELSLPLDS